MRTIKKRLWRDLSVLIRFKFFHGIYKEFIPLNAARPLSVY